VQLEGLDELKNLMTSSGIKTGMQVRAFILLTYDLFKDALRNSSYIVSNIRFISQ
jgi:hypothetical protein